SRSIRSGSPVRRRGIARPAANCPAMESSRPSQIYGFPASSHRVSAASGVVAVVLLLVSFAILGTNVPTYDDAPQVFARFYADKSSTIELSMLLGIVGGAAFLWFVGFIRWS